MPALSAALATKTMKTLAVPATWVRQSPQRGICFTNQHSFRQPRIVRTSFAVWFLVTAALCCVHAQDQEKKLVDRLLKPDMALQNDAQNKKFTGDGSASINKRASVRAFYVHQKPSSKNYSGTRDFSTTQFYSQTSHAADAPPTRFRHSKHLQIRRLPMQVRPPAVFVTHLSPEKGRLSCVCR